MSRTRLRKKSLSWIWGQIIGLQIQCFSKSKKRWEVLPANAGFFPLPSLVVLYPDTKEHTSLELILIFTKHCVKVISSYLTYDPMRCSTSNPILQMREVRLRRDGAWKIIQSASRLSLSLSTQSLESVCPAAQHSAELFLAGVSLSSLQGPVTSPSSTARGGDVCCSLHPSLHTWRCPALNLLCPLADVLCLWLGHRKGVLMIPVYKAGADWS